MCESRRDGGCSCCERGVLGGEGGELSSVHCVGGEVKGQVVYMWVVWSLFKGCVVLKGTAGSGQLGR